MTEPTRAPSGLRRRSGQVVRFVVRKLAGRLGIAPVDLNWHERRAEMREWAEIQISELWRRAEAADARQAVYMQRLSAHVDEISHEQAASIEHLSHLIEPIRRENAALLRLVGAADADHTASPTPVVTRSVLFRELERGSRAEVRKGLDQYLDLLAGHAPVLDLGCGRGEFLELARDHGIDAYGIDGDTEAVTECRALGLDAREDDMFSFLETVEANSLGAIVCFQVVEHLDPNDISGLFDRCSRALAPSGVLLFETPNPASFSTHVQSFWRDPTHIRPVPSAVLELAAKEAGLLPERIVFSSPVAAETRLRTVAAVPDDPDLVELVCAYNTAVQQLNELLYGPQNYALVAVKPG